MSKRPYALLINYFYILILSAPRLLVFTPSFVGEESSELWARIYEEYQSLSKKFKLIIITEEITSEDTENISLVKIGKISVRGLNILYRLLAISYATIKQRKAYNLAFIRTLDYSYMFAGIIAKKLLKTKLIVFISNTETGHIGITRKFYRALYKRILVSADVVVSTSTHLIDDVEKYIGTIDKSKVVFVKMGINTSRFKPLNIERNKHEILYVGRIRKIKGIEDIIQALPTVIKSIPDTKFRIIGNIHEKNHFYDLKNLVLNLHCEKNVEFVGPIPHDQLVQHYNSVSILVITPRSGEGHTNVINEAMACELPVIATPVGSIPELIEDGKNGFIIQPYQSKILAERIILLLKNKELQTKIGKEARKTVENNGNTDSYIEELSKIISNVTTKSN